MCLTLWITCCASTAAIQPWCSRSGLPAGRATALGLRQQQQAPRLVKQSPAIGASNCRSLQAVSSPMPRQGFLMQGWMRPAGPCRYLAGLHITSREPEQQLSPSRETLVAHSAMKPLQALALSATLLAAAAALATGRQLNQEEGRPSCQHFALPLRSPAHGTACPAALTLLTFSRVRRGPCRSAPPAAGAATRSRRRCRPAPPRLRCPAGHLWAVLVAGSAGYGNYRHQADVAHVSPPHCSLQLWKVVGTPPRPGLYHF